MVYGDTFLRNSPFYAKTLTKLHGLTEPCKDTDKLNGQASLLVLAPYFFMEDASSNLIVWCTDNMEDLKGQIFCILMIFRQKQHPIFLDSNINSSAKGLHFTAQQQLC
jgi:hypothetical protein